MSVGGSPEGVPQVTITLFGGAGGAAAQGGGGGSASRLAAARDSSTSSDEGESKWETGRKRAGGADDGGGQDAATRVPQAPWRRTEGGDGDDEDDLWGDSLFSTALSEALKAGGEEGSGEARARSDELKRHMYLI